jgi:hypothetical protein
MDLYENHSHQKSNDKLGGYVKYLLYPKGGGYRVEELGFSRALSKLTKYLKRDLNIKSCDFTRKKEVRSQYLFDRTNIIVS